MSLSHSKSGNRGLAEWSPPALSVVVAILFTLLIPGTASAGARPNYSYDGALNKAPARVIAEPARVPVRAATERNAQRSTTGLSTLVASVVAAETEGASAVDAAASEARGGVYTLRDEAGAVVRTGRTSDLAAREAAHFNDPVLGEYRFNVEYRTDLYAEQRGLEQMLYDRYPEAQFENGGFNKIRGISLSNPNLPFYMQAAQDYLADFGGG